MKLKHVALYSKHWYKRTDLWEDLRACLTADGYSANEEFWKKRDTVGVIMHNVPVIFEGMSFPDYTVKLLAAIDPHYTWSYGYVHSGTPPMLSHYDKDLKDYDYEEAIIRFLLSELCNSETVKLGGLPKADEKVLPLRRETK